MAKDTIRLCACVGCEAIIEERQIMCRPHWSSVDPELRREIGEACRPGSPGEHRPSIDWLAAVVRAVELVANREGQPVYNRFRRALDLMEVRAKKPVAVGAG